MNLMRLINRLWVQANCWMHFRCLSLTKQMLCLEKVILLPLYFDLGYETILDISSVQFYIRRISECNQLSKKSRQGSYYYRGEVEVQSSFNNIFFVFFDGNLAY